MNTDKPKFSRLLGIWMYDFFIYDYKICAKLGVERINFLVDQKRTAMLDTT